jgi:hypothetical protein
VEANKQDLTSQSNPVRISTELDIDEPLSFKDWYSTHTSIAPGQEYNVYNQYLTTWYAEKKLTRKTAYNTQLRINYLQLLQQLQVFFTKSEKEKWYNFINFNDDKEILLAIPFFAKKLKEIALHYIDLRKKVKTAKLQYNLGGTNQNYTLELQNFLLDNFSKHESNKFRIPSWVYNYIPELSSVKNELVVQVEEIYDDHEYLDQSPDVPVTTYYNLSDYKTTEFLKTKNLNLLKSEWLYNNTVVFSSDAFNPEVSLSLANEYIVKYIGEDKYTSNIQIPTVEVEKYDLTFKTGDNYFLWPAGTYKSSVISDKRYSTIALTSIGFEMSGTAGINIEGSDTIFVRTAKGLKGAWLYDQREDTYTDTMVAYFEANKKTPFLFPYPGYGLSSESFEWTGPTLTYNSDFYFLDEQIRKNIEKAYWSQNIVLTSVDSIKINNTALVSARAYPNQVYDLSDKIYVWDTPPLYTETVYNGEIQEAWLYKLNQTCLPVAPNGNSVIYWPYERINTSEVFPSYYPDNAFVCAPQSLNTITTPYSIAGANIDEADTIYKLNNYQDNIEDAVECAWLSGQKINFNHSRVVCVEQPSLLLNIQPGTFQRFVWLGNNLVDVNSVFKTVAHQPDCAFKLKNYDFTNHEKCTCKNVLFTPFGHPGNTYFDNNGYADFILQETDLTLGNTIDLSMWKDSVGLDYKLSPHFMWYRSGGKIGWGAGKWVNELASSVPKLQKGKRYIYFRANIKTTDTPLPTYTLRFNYNTFNNTKFTWIQGRKTEDGTWVSANTPSKFTINQGDILLYKRQGTTNHSLTSVSLNKTTISENRNSIWSTYDYLTVADPQDPVSKAQQTIYVNYPNVNFQDFATASTTIPGVPSVPFEKILEVKEWSLTDPKGGVTKYNTPSFSFTPLITGVYNISVTVLTGTNTTYSFNAAGNLITTPGSSGLYSYTKIPPITAVSTLQPVTSLTSVPCDAPGFILETYLYGWDYGTYSQRTVTTPGARPFWAKGNTSKNILNKFKGSAGWGTPVRFYDTHNPVTQPEFSDIVLAFGQYVEYERKQPQSIFWEQPVTINRPTSNKQWCEIDFKLTTPSTLSSALANFPLNIDLISIPTTAPSQITLTNIIDNEPVEVVYNAINPYTWTLTVTAEITNTTTTPATAYTYHTAARPWNHITNRFNPTVAHAPTLEHVYTQKDTGGYFLPNSLGLSLYNSKDYTYNLSTSSATLSSLFEDVNKHVAGRGLTKTKNLSPFVNVKEDSTWLKDSLLTGILAGNVNRDIVKKYQKFVPYQPSNESNTNKQTGLVTPKSKLTPWGGNESSRWTDTQNNPASLVGEYNTDIWTDNQQLKNTNNRVYNWSTDIYGNQYALYKDIKNVNLYEQKYVPGMLWVRKNSQKVQPAYIALSGIFDTYKKLPLYTELTGSGILKIDVFFDTLYIETTGVVIFEKINYDYNTDTIYSFVDSSHVLSLPLPVQTTLNREFNNTLTPGLSTAKVGETWFLPEQKIVLLSVCELSAGNLIPTIYELDIAKVTLSKVFPV